MKIDGKEVKRSGPRPCVIPRVPEEDNLVFLLVPIHDFSEFNARFKEPMPPVKMRPGKVKEKNFESPVYQSQMKDYLAKQNAWVTLKCLQANNPDGTGLQFATVSWDDPDTWNNWLTECRESGMTEGEISHILSEVRSVNGISEDAYVQARESFLSMGRLESLLSSQTVEPSSTASGESVNDGA